MFGQLSFLTFLCYQLLLQCSAALEPVRQRERQSLEAENAEAVKRAFVHSRDLNSVRLSSCNRGTVAGLTVGHWKMLEEKYKEFGCWKSKVTKLFALLYKEEKLGQHFEYPSGSQGYRLRCRLLFKFDLCRSNFIRVRSAYHPEVDTDWPEPVLMTIAEHSALDDAEDYGDDYYYSYGNFNGDVGGQHGSSSSSHSNNVNYEN